MKQNFTANVRNSLKEKKEHYYIMQSNNDHFKVITYLHNKFQNPTHAILHKGKPFYKNYLLTQQKVVIF